jgi:hypothetical protein
MIVFKLQRQPASNMHGPPRKIYKSLHPSSLIAPAILATSALHLKKTHNPFFYPTYLLPFCRMPAPVWGIVILAVGAGITATGEVVKCKTGPSRCPGVKRDVIPGKLSSANASFVPFSRIARRQEDDPAVGPCGVAQFEYDRCKADADTVIVQTSIPAPGGM